MDTTSDQARHRRTVLSARVAHAGLVALASRLRTTLIATFDERHFRAVRPLTGGSAFRLLPLDV